MDVVVYQGSDDWSALYVDGKLKQVGDHYLADEAIRKLFGVKTICSDAFMRGGQRYEDVANSLEEVEAYERGEQEAFDSFLEQARVQVRLENKQEKWYSDKQVREQLGKHARLYFTGKVLTPEGDIQEMSVNKLLARYDA